MADTQVIVSGGPTNVVQVATPGPQGIPGPQGNPGPQGALVTTPTTVALLPSPTAGLRSMVTNATASTFNSVVAGGGANTVPVFADGVVWRVG
jgi:hypothetical protein